MTPMTAVRPRVRWGEIREYAQRFEEYMRVILHVRKEDERVHVPLARVTARHGVARFGPLARGASLPGGWSLARFARGSDNVRISLAGSEGAEVELCFSEAREGERPGPFDLPGLRGYHGHTALPFARFRDAGDAVKQQLREAAAGDLSGAFARWREVLGRSTSNRETPDEDATQLEVRADRKVYLRITDACQERCTFCFFYDADAVDNLLRRHDLSAVIEQLDPAEIRQVVLTGGEPTLHPRLHEYVARLAERGFREIILQTNGIRLAEAGYLEKLLPYRDQLGLGFSIHATTEATNDAVTTVSEGYLPLKFEALERALEMGFRCKVLWVLSRLNLHETTDFVERVATYAQRGNLYAQFSLPSFEGRMIQFLDTYPRLEELRDVLPPALRRARELGLRLSFSHQCQVPPCALPDDLPHLESLWFDNPTTMWEQGRTYAPACADCALRPRCSGIWEDYPKHFSLDALRPFAPDDLDGPP